MANTAVKISALPASSSLTGAAKIPAVDSTGNTVYIAVSNLLGNTASNVAVRATRLLSNVAPSTSSSNGSSGDVAWDSTFLYVCVATNTWKRSALSSF